MNICRTRFQSAAGTVIPSMMVFLLLFSGTGFVESAEGDFEKELVSFLGEPRFEMQKIFDGERFPNVVVTKAGTVVASWGRNTYRVRRSEDGGKTWGEAITVADPGFHGGGLMVDASTGDLFAFIQEEHPPSPSIVYRSRDDGLHWEKFPATFRKDKNGNVPSLHMSETGLTLSHPPNRGRLLRPARVYERPIGYNTAIYSDDGGKTWIPSAPFPLQGTGEGAIVELSDGTLYYSSRKHWFAEDAPLRHDRSHAWSDDGGETWENPGFHEDLPDGPRYRGEEGRGSNYNGHFGMMCGLTRLPISGKDILIYSNADHSGHERIRMTVWGSFDGGKTWPVKRLVFEGPSAYSSLASGRAGTPTEGWIYLQFEGGPEGKYSGGQMVRFNLTWMLDGKKIEDFLPSQTP